jgi:hypothetical protein
MGPFAYVGGLFLVIAVVTYLNHRRQQPKEIRVDEVPDLVHDEIQVRVPAFQADRAVRKGDSFRLEGQTVGQPIRIKVKLRGIGAGRYVFKVEIQLEIRSAWRSLKGKHLIEEREVPEVVIRKARQAAATYGASIREITRVKAATVKGRDAYDIRAWSGDWRVEVELLDDGEILELELDYRPGQAQRT